MNARFLTILVTLFGLQATSSEAWGAIRLDSFRIVSGDSLGIFITKTGRDGVGRILGRDEIVSISLNGRSVSWWQLLTVPKEDGNARITPFAGFLRVRGKKNSTPFQIRYVKHLSQLIPFDRKFPLFALVNGELDSTSDATTVFIEGWIKASTNGASTREMEPGKVEMLGKASSLNVHGFEINRFLISLSAKEVENLVLIPFDETLLESPKVTIQIRFKDLAEMNSKLTLNKYDIEYIQKNGTEANATRLLASFREMRKRFKAADYEGSAEIGQAELARILRRRESLPLSIVPEWLSITAKAYEKAGYPEKADPLHKIISTRYPYSSFYSESLLRVMQRRLRFKREKEWERRYF